MILQAAREKLGWPQSEEIFSPTGTATRLTAELADQKIGRALRLQSGDSSIRVGVLAANSDLTEAPLAIVCQFSRPAPPEILLEAQRLAWNFSRSLLLLTIEPTLIRKWSCYEKPKTPQELTGRRLSTAQALDRSRKTPQILPVIEFDPNAGEFTNQDAAFSLSWLDLISSAFFAREEKRFKAEGRADKVLLDNLKFVRGKLRALDLDDEFSHDLLARTIFAQFLFDRTDSENRAALNPEKLAELQDQGILHARYEHLGQLFESYEDTYAFFRWLNERFNGDLFPGKGDTPEQREAGWAREQRNVGPQHLKILAEFVSGELEMGKGQYCFWRQYAFDAIPLELISSIYEEFVTDATGAHYTPSHLVDLMLDRVLPWESSEWDLKILDPSCGSGIFLVKSYQRLIYRWKQAQRTQGSQNVEIPAAVLRQILERNLFGVDEHKGAVRVASFSLYLAMCDEIDPRHYWSDEDKVSFPTLRNRTLIGRDFFAEDTAGFRTQEEAGIYDLVIGNPPWGDATVSELAGTWLTQNAWSIANKDFGILFAVKAMTLTKPNGFVCLVQSAGALLYNHSSEARKIQTRVFQHWKKIECVVNLAVFRPFKAVKVPTCVLVASNREPDGSPFWYECPKRLYTPEDEKRITVDLTEMHPIYSTELEDEPWIWSALMWGGARDRALLRKTQYFESLSKVERQLVRRREGINRGDKKKEQKDLIGRRILNAMNFPSSGSLSLRDSQLPINQDAFTDSRAATDLSAFNLPQLLIKSSWIREKNRFQARLVKSSNPEHGALCSQSYISVHVPIEYEDVLEAACLAYNSTWSNYFLLLTSGRFAFDRAEPLNIELRSLPLPLESGHLTLPSSRVHRFDELIESDEQGDVVSSQDIDNAVFDAFDFQPSERILIEDLAKNTLSDFKWRGKSPSHRATKRTSRMPDEAIEDESDLRRYCETLLQTLASNYGADKAIAARIWSETDGESPLPMRYVSIILGAASQRGVQIWSLENQQLRQRILLLHRFIRENQRENGYSQQARDYATFEENGETGVVLNILKPDWLRHWTRSMALRDADAIVRDFWIWQSGSQATLSDALPVENAEMAMVPAGSGSS